MSCNVPPLETPPGFTTSGRYLVVIDQYDNTKIMENPDAPSILGFNGTEWYGITGSDQKPLLLPGIPNVPSTTVLKGLLGKDAAGRIFSLVNESAVQKIFGSLNGEVQLIDVPTLGDDGFPVGLNGLLKRVTVDGVTTDSWLNFNGVVYISPEGNATSIANGSSGDVLQMVGPVPEFAPMPSGSIGSGTASIDLAGVVANSIGTSKVNIKSPVFGLTNGSGTLTVRDVNITVDIALAGNPLLGLDVDSVESSTWYFYYIISNGSATSGVISKDPHAPDLTTNPAFAGYTYWGLAGTFYHQVTGTIRPFIQRGRSFTMLPLTYGIDILCTSTMAVVPGPSLTSYLPPGVKSVSGIVGGSSNAATSRAMVMASDANGLGKQYIGSIKELTTEVDGFERDAGCFYDLAIFNPDLPEIYWRCNGSDNFRKIAFTGYRI